MHHQPAEISDDQLRESIRSLTEKQRQAYDMVQGQNEKFELHET